MDEVKGFSTVQQIMFSRDIDDVARYYTLSAMQRSGSVDSVEAFLAWSHLVNVVLA
jgi:hypothetical protein